MSLYIFVALQIPSTGTSNENRKHASVNVECAVLGGKRRKFEGVTPF